MMRMNTHSDAGAAMPCDLQRGDHIRVAGWPDVWLQVVTLQGRDVLVAAPNRVFALVPRVAVCEVVRP